MAHVMSKAKCMDRRSAAKLGLWRSVLDSEAQTPRGLPESGVGRLPRGNLSFKILSGSTDPGRNPATGAAPVPVIVRLCRPSEVALGLGPWLVRSRLCLLDTSAASGGDSEERLRSRHTRRCPSLCGRFAWVPACTGEAWATLGQSSGLVRGLQISRFSNELHP